MKNLSLKLKLLIPLIGIGIIFGFLLSMWSPNKSRNLALEIQKNQAEFIANLMADNLSLGMQTMILDDGAALEQTLDMIKSGQDSVYMTISEIVIYDTDLNFVKRLSKDTTTKSLEPVDSLVFIDSDSKLSAILPMKDVSSSIVGYLSLDFSKKYLREKVIDNLIESIIFTIIILIISLGIGYYFIHNILKFIRSLTNSAKSISHGDLNVEINTDSKDELGELGKSFLVMKDVLNNLIKEINLLTSSIAQGNIKVRANSTGFQGAYKEIIDGVNENLDLIIYPLDVSAKYVDDLSNGILPSKITEEFKGDFNLTKKNLNTLIATLEIMRSDLSITIKEQKEGNIDAKCNPSKLKGIYSEIMNGINDTIDSLAEPLLESIEIIHEYAEGDLSREMRTLPGQQIILTNALNTIRTNLNKMIDDVDMLVQSAENGELSVRADNTKHKGDYRKIISGINDTLDNIVTPLKTSAEYVEKLSKGIMPKKLEVQYKGDFNEIKNNLNQLIITFESFISEIKSMYDRQKKGDIDAYMNKTKFDGFYNEMANGVNETIKNPIQMNLKMLDILKNYSEGNFEQVLEQQPGKRAVANETMNLLRDNLLRIVSELDKIIIATKEGNLKFRGNHQSFKGSYRDIVLGFNESLDSIINPLNKAAEYIESISLGNIPKKIEENYSGDFNSIKNSINKLIQNLNTFVIELESMYRNQKAGDTDAYTNQNKFEGVYFEMAKGVNESVNIHVENIGKILRIIKSYAEGDFAPVLDELPGKQYVVNERIDLLRKNLLNINEELNIISSAVSNGNLNARGNVDRFYGGWAELVAGFNKMIEAVDKPVSELKSVLGRLAINDYTKHVDTEYKGVWNELKSSINELIDNLENIQNILVNIGSGNTTDLPELKAIGAKSENDKLIPSMILMMESLQVLINDTKILSEAATSGNLSVRGDSNKHSGDFRKVIDGFNTTLDSILEPINEAGKVLSIMETGDLTVRMTGNYSGDNQRLKNSINNLGASLAELISQLYESVQTVMHSSENILNTTSNIANESNQQNSQIDDVATAVEEMSKTVSENADSATKTAKVAEANRAIAVEGGNVVKETIKKMNDIAQVVSQSAINIEKLGASSQHISEIISVIDEIADQTNLLALNAAIEAARAGDQGRGFAVVADEVRKLAERTTVATKKIADMIKGIQNETQDSVKVMNKGNEEVHEGIKLADKAGDSLNQVVNSSQEVMNMISQIASATEEQSSTSDEISKSVYDISRLTGNTSIQINSIADSTKNLNELTINLRQLMNRFKFDSTRRMENKQLPGRKSRLLN